MNEFCIQSLFAAKAEMWRGLQVRDIIDLSVMKPDANDRREDV